MQELTRLRRRFILILMCSVGIVLTVALVVNVATSYSSQYNRIKDSLSKAMSIEGGDELRPLIGGGGDSSSASIYFNETLTTPPAELDAPLADLSSESTSFGVPVPVYVIDINKNTGEITSHGNAAEMDETTLYTALIRLQEEGNENSSGLFSDLGLFYSQHTLSSGDIRIAFADASSLYENTLQQALTALLIWVLGMVAFFILSLVLSRIVLKPVEEAWTRQRQFVADASHELKTPLTIILANTNIIQAHPEKPTSEQQQWLESTQEEANRMNAMVTDLLLLAQLEDEGGLIDDSAPTSTGAALSNAKKAGALAGGAGGARTASAAVDLSTLVERSLLQFDAVFFERGISEESNIEPGLFIMGNKEHLRRLIDVLLDNASKYGNRGGTAVVNLKRSSDKSNSALLTVSNSGAYIPPHKTELIFERFYRGDAAHGTAVEGSGLGLALAQEIVREHGGSIYATSEPLEAGELGAAGTSGESGASGEQDVVEPIDVNAEELPAQTTLSVTLPLVSGK